jgi:hypothetical protein
MGLIKELTEDEDFGNLDDLLHLLDDVEDCDLDLEGKMPTEDDVLEWQGKGWLWE